MKILMVSSFLPYPLINGGNIRLYNLLKNLNKRWEITLICERRDFQDKKDVEEVEKICKKVITVNRKKQWGIGNFLRTGFSLDPFLVVGHKSEDMKQKIDRELKENNFDLIHVETFYVMQNLPKTLLPIILVEHNIEYLVYKRFADYSKFFLKPFLNLDILKIKNKEKASWRKANVLIAVSQKEKEIMHADEVVPNGIDIEKFKFQSSKFKFEEKEKRVLFIGDFRWIENKETAKWIIKEIWPEIKLKADSKMKLWIVGKNIPDNIKNLTKDEDVIFDENASDDTQLIYKNSYLLLSPIRVGGGTSFKILEAMSCGVPVVTTILGAGGITSGNELISADNFEEILNGVLKLMNDKNYYENIAKSARRLVEEKYNWQQITKKLEDVYANTIKKYA